MIPTPKTNVKTYHSGHDKRCKGVASDRMRVFAKCSYIHILFMVNAKTHETFPRLFHRMPKNPKFLVENLVVRTRVTL